MINEKNNTFEKASRSGIQVYEWAKAPEEIKEKIMRRAQADMGAIEKEVAQWIAKLVQGGDKAMVEYAQKYDDPKFALEKLRVSDADIKEAYENTDTEVLQMIREQIRISRIFHEKQRERMETSWQIETVPGVITGAKKAPIESVGLYVPAGKAPLPTVAQILTVAAKAAGVPRIVVCFAPTGDYHEIIVAANEAGANEIYRVGGVQAIGALTYGTATIAPVNFIAGP